MGLEFSPLGDNWLGLIESMILPTTAANISLRVEWNQRLNDRRDKTAATSRSQKFSALNARFRDIPIE